MRIAIWNELPGAFLLSGLASGTVPVEIEVVEDTRATCLQMLHDGAVDVALVPTVTVLEDPGAYDVLPTAAFSTWGYPYARVMMRRGLEGPPRTVAVDPAFAQEVLLTRIILKEHYGFEPRFISYEGRTDQLRTAKEDAVLLVAHPAPAPLPDTLALDLGQEWYELVNYPMVWGVFALRKEEATDYHIQLFREVAKAADAERKRWRRSQELDEETFEFFGEDMRVHLDDLAIASLTELQQLLFYYGVTPDITEVPFVHLTEDEATDDEDG